MGFEVFVQIQSRTEKHLCLRYVQYCVQMQIFWLSHPINLVLDPEIFINVLLDVCFLPHLFRWSM